MSKRLAAIIVLLLLFLSLALYWNLFVTNQATVAARLLVNILTPLNSLLMLILFFMLARSLVKLYFDARGKKSGFKLRTKLVVSLLPLTLVPALMMFFFASRLPSKVMEDLALNEDASLLFQSSRTLKETYLEDVKHLLTGHQSNLINFCRRQDWKGLKKYVEKQNLHGIECYQDQSLIQRVVHPDWQIEITNIQDSARFFTVQGNPTRRDNGTFIWRFPIVDKNITIHILFLKTRQFTAPFEQMEQHLDAFSMLERKKDDVSDLYRSTLLVGTLAVIFGGIWMGLSFSRTFLNAINSLAQGAKRVEGGDFTAQVDLKTGDEIEVVGHAFNAMTQALGKNQEEIQQKTDDLESLNQQLERQFHYNQTLLQEINAGIISCGLNGEIMTLNPAARSILLQDEEPKDLIAWLTQHGQSHLANQIKKVIEEKIPSFNQLISLEEWESQGTRNVQCSAVSLKMNEEKIGVLLVLEDLTPLLNAQKLAAWREVAQRVAHEIKNPLTPIQLSAQRVKRKLEMGSEDLDKAIESAYSTIMNETNILKSLVDDFSAFAKLPAPHKTELELSQLVRDWVDSNRDIFAETDLECEGEATWVQADASQIRQILRNLVNNAVQAMSDLAEKKVHLKIKQNNERAIVEVIDFGKGIDAGDLDHIFLPYYSKAAKGTGLGLAIVKRIVQDHNGTILAKHNQPKGTVIQMDFPLIQKG